MTQAPEHDDVPSTADAATSAGPTEAGLAVASRPDSSVTLHPRRRRGRGPGAWVTALLVLFVLAAGALLVHDGLVLLLDRGGDPWLGPVMREAADVRPTDIVLGVGILLVLAGLWLFVAGVRPRRQRGFALRTGTGTTLQGRDIAQVAATAARAVAGVTSAQARVSRRAVVIQVQAAARTAPVAEIEGAVAGALQEIDGLPRLTVSRRDDKNSRSVL